MALSTLTASRRAPVVPRLASMAPSAPDPTGVTTRPAPSRYVELDVWRVVAAASIPIFHVWQTMGIANGGHNPLQHNHLWMGLMHVLQTAPDAFFLISAMVLVPPLVRNAIDGKPNDWSVFLRRRFFRVMPLYWILIIVVWSYRNFSFATVQLPDLLLHLVFLQQFSSKDIFFDNGPAWSLALEVTFYLMIPVWIGLTTRLVRGVRSRRLRIAAFCAGPVLTAAASGGYKELGVVLHIPFDHWAWWFNYPSRADMFGLGCLVAIWVALRGPKRRLGLAPTIGLRLLGVAVLFTLPWFYGHDPVWYYSAAGAAYAPILAAAVLGTPILTPRLARFGTERIGTMFVWLAGFTFSIYLGQEPVIVFFSNSGLTPAAASRLLVNEILGMVGVLAFGYLLWVFIEGPAYKLRWLPEARRRHARHAEALLLE
jgi:peptidoglycan/LPS O-acetylase OafA/YrhL